jgi:diketogulonate reductase-like aldo/keto reductase
MRQKNSYSRILQGITTWERAGWGEKIKLFQHCVEKDITSFLAISPRRETLQDNSLGTALSESGLSRDEIQLLGGVSSLPKNPDELVAQVEQTLTHLKTDYLDLFFLDLHSPAEVVLPAIERLVSQGKIMETGVYELHSPSVSASLEENSVKANLTDWDFTPAAMKSLTLNMPTSVNLKEMMWIHLPQSESYNHALAPLVQKYQHNPQELLLAWFLQHPSHYHPVISGNKAEEIDEAARAHHLRLIEEDWNKIPSILETS